jgi:hypothetical protein
MDRQAAKAGIIAENDFPVVVADEIGQGQLDLGGWRGGVARRVADRLPGNLRQGPLDVRTGAPRHLALVAGHQVTDDASLWFH